LPEAKLEPCGGAEAAVVAAASPKNGEYVGTVNLAHFIQIIPIIM
jgi:DNA replicative helicase MCM subunit Mcm2 (Cdc46/Mcm family)